MSFTYFLPVIYEDSLTEAFVECITKILQTPPVKRFYLALEKRYTILTITSINYLKKDIVKFCPL